MALKTTNLKCNVSDMRLDVFLAGNIDGLSRNAAQKLIDQGLVTALSCDNKKIEIKKNHKTSFGEIFTVTQSEPDNSEAVAQNIGLDVIFEDDDVIVVNKPQGMVVHPAPGHSGGTLVNALLYHCGDSLSGIGGILRPGIVHRIDKDTSGLIVAAKNDAAHLSLTEQLASRSLKREYDAIVCGVLKNDSGTIDAPVGRHKSDRKRQAVYPKGALVSSVRIRDAITHFDVLSRYNRYTHVCCRLETGRTHQIRVHMAHIGHPVLGDNIYGRCRKSPDYNISGQCLHARSLVFIHPKTGDQINLSTDLPEYFQSILNKLESECKL